MNGRSEDSNPGSQDEFRSSLIEQVVVSHLQRRLEGKDVDDAELLAKYPDLMPELADQLKVHREIANLRAGARPTDRNHRRAETKNHLPYGRRH